MNDYDTVFWLQRESEQVKPTITVTGQVLEVSNDVKKIYLHLIGLIDDDREAWVSIPPEMPYWALSGTVFKAELSEDVGTFEEINKRLWAIRGFKPSETVFLTDDEIMEELSDFEKRLNDRTIAEQGYQD